MTSIASLLTGVAALLLAALLFAWTAWAIDRRFGARGLVLAWIVGAVFMSTLMAARVHVQQAALGFTEEQQRAFAPFPTFLLMCLAGLGAVTLVLYRRRRAGVEKFQAGTAVRSLGAFVLGVLGFFVIYAIVDVLGVVRGM